jgi:hypothetical protein
LRKARKDREVSVRLGAIQTTHAGMRWATALAVVAVACAAAVYVHQRTVRVGSPAGVIFFKSKEPVATLPNIEIPAYRHPSWEDPVAVLIALGGLATAGGVVTYGRTFAKPS